MEGIPSHLIQKIEGLVDLNMVEDAAEECLRLVECYPGNAELLVFCAGTVSLGTAEQIKRLMVAIEQYLQVYPHNLAVREVWAVLLSLDKRYHESLAEFTKVPPDKRRPDANWVWFRTLLDCGAKEQIREWITTEWPNYSIKIRQKNFRAYLRFLWEISSFFADDGRNEEAANGYQFLLKHDPTAIRAYLEYGQLLARMGNKKEAQEVFQGGLRLTAKQVDDQICYPGEIVGYGLEEHQRIDRCIRAELDKLVKGE